MDNYVYRVLMKGLDNFCFLFLPLLTHLSSVLVVFWVSDKKGLGKKKNKKKKQKKKPPDGRKGKKKKDNNYTSVVAKYSVKKT
ncbi:hypothetical protein CAEBREN_03641 [Caenorhabditis brenneri]|uniref:Uncharacterized protein n=1 Tax=Caenorhabditis brenneri TaxID=135651 RepID=G0MB20_CAEBE|nr:hypothetical protein CAEBREN_03641 [Caenorhabditis brenneri]